jgi:hypothetical protein
MIRRRSEHPPLGIPTHRDQRLNINRIPKPRHITVNARQDRPRRKRNAH